jgi:hypothetical protein
MNVMPVEATVHLCVMNNTNMAVVSTNEGGRDSNVFCGKNLPRYVIAQLAKCAAGCKTMALEPTQPPIQWVPGALSLGVKWPEREVDHSPPSSAEVKERWSYTSTPPIRLHGVVISQKKHRDNLPLRFMNI